MNNPAFSHPDFAQLIKKFSAEMPRLLLRHASTAELALDIERLNLEEIFHQRFTVAVVGQMRVGKSTLVNALIGEDLAPVETTETTATVNWFRYSEKKANHFRVHWKDGSSQDIALSEKKKWSGREENAQKTKSLDFFAQSDFLKTANVVDTPGTRSAIASHEKTITAFLAEELERESLAHGGRADAIVYVINPLARPSDQEILTLFGEKTRLPGASATNSIAVVQKWEHLKPDPFKNVQKKCERLKEQLAGKVADVIPVSGLLARLSSTVPAKIWELLLKLVKKSEPDALSQVLTSERLFTRGRKGKELKGISLTLDQLKRIVSSSNDKTVKIPWSVIPVCAFIIGQHPDVTVSTLPQLVREKSGIDRLDDQVKERFFKRAQAIKANTVIAKAKGPCDTGLLRLEKAQEEAETLLKDGKHCKSELENGISEQVISYLEKTTSLFQQDLDELNSLVKQLDDLRNITEDNCKSFDAEERALVLLEDEGCDLAECDKAELRALFGVDGIEPDRRLSRAKEAPDGIKAIMQKQPLKRSEAEKKKLAKYRKTQMASADKLLDKWNERAQTGGGDVKEMAEIAVDRINQLCIYLDPSEVTDEPDCN